MIFRHFFSGLFLFISIFINTSVFGIQLATLHDGFALGTIVHTNEGLQKIESLQEGDLVLSKDLENNLQIICPITNISKEIIPSYVEIRLEHETIITALGQKFHLDTLNKWVTAQELIQSPELKAQFDETILEIRQVDESIEIYKLTISYQHNFYVTEKLLLVHNFVPVFVAPAAPAIVGVAATIVIPAVKIAGGAIFGWFISKFLESFKHRPTIDSSMFQDQGKKNEDQPTEDKPHNDKKKSKEKRSEQKQSAGPGGPGDPNWPPKKNSNNNNKEPDNNNDDKKNEKKEDKDNSEKKDNEQKKNDPQQQKIQNQLSSSEISKYIAENAENIAKELEEPLKKLIETGNVIKDIEKGAFDIQHIFSYKHIKHGLMKLGESIQNISQNAEIISKRIIEVVGKADKNLLLREGPNRIQTEINDILIEVRVFIENGMVRSFDAFINYSKNQSPNITKM